MNYVMMRVIEERFALSFSLPLDHLLLLSHTFCTHE